MLILVPSRGRPANLARLLPMLENRATVVVRVDHCDERLAEYLDIERPANVEMVVGSRVKAAGAMAETLQRYPMESCYGLIGDDTLVHTPGWADMLEGSAGDWRISYPDDMLKGKEQATHPIIGGEFLRAIGFWSLPGLVHLYTDTVWDYLGRVYNNLVYRPDVVFEHLHWTTGKSPMDATYERVWNGQSHAEKDQACFTRWQQKYRIDNGLRSRVAASAVGTSTRSPILAL